VAFNRWSAVLVFACTHSTTSSVAVFSPQGRKPGQTSRLQPGVQQSRSAPGPHRISLSRHDLDPVCTSRVGLGRGVPNRDGYSLYRHPSASRRRGQGARGVRYVAIRSARPDCPLGALSETAVAFSWRSMVPHFLRHWLISMRNECSVFLWVWLWFADR
jgi:hypothetical protein